jgi:hypothetical protein
VAQVIKRIQAHYEIHEVEMGTVYRWSPESVIVKCNCGEKLILTTSQTTCSECSADYAAITEEVLDDRPEDKVVRPWRSVGGSYYAPTRGA